MNAFMKPSIELEFEPIGHRIDEIMRSSDATTETKLETVFEHLEQFLRVANPKDTTFSIYLTILKKLSNYFNESMMKYQSEEAFLAQYPSFQHHTRESLRLLRNTANWMYILFRFVASRKNKGLAMSVIPRHVEGPNAQYITGSGQTQATADRVLIYETEGDVKPIRRGKPRSRSASSGGYASVTNVSQYYGRRKKHPVRRTDTPRPTPHRALFSYFPPSANPAAVDNDQAPPYQQSHASTVQLYTEDLLEADDDFAATLELLRQTSTSSITSDLFETLPTPQLSGQSTNDYLFSGFSVARNASVSSNSSDAMSVQQQSEYVYNTPDEDRDYGVYRIPYKRTFDAVQSPTSPCLSPGAKHARYSSTPVIDEDDLPPPGHLARSGLSFNLDFLFNDDNDASEVI